MLYSENLSIDDIRSLTLIVINANLRVKVEDRSDLLYNVILKKDDPNYKPILKRSNRNLEIRFQKKSSNILFGFIGLNSSNVKEVYVELPKVNIDLNIRTVSGEVHLEDLKTNSLNLVGVSGNVKLENLTANSIKISTVSGDIISDNMGTRRISLSSVSGDGKFLNVGKQIENVNISTVSGDIDLGFKYNKLVNVYASTTSGDVKSNVPLYRLNKGRFTNFASKENPEDVAFIKISSVSGDLHLKFPEEKEMESMNVYTPADEDDEFQKVVKMIKNGILKKEEGIEILKTIGYTDDEIHKLEEEEL